MFLSGRCNLQRGLCSIAVNVDEVKVLCPRLYFESTPLLRVGYVISFQFVVQNLSIRLKRGFAVNADCLFPGGIISRFSITIAYRFAPYIDKVVCP